jgi:two-component system response regulator YesN
MIKAMVVDDERLVRKGFISLVDWSSYGIVIVGEAADGKSALEQLRQTEVDLLFTDITMPGLSGFDLMKQVRQLYPHIHSVVLTCHHEFDFIQEAIRLGAIDYIVKTLLEMESVDKVMKRIVERVEWEEGSRRIYHAVKLEKRFPSKEALLFRPLAKPPQIEELYRLPVVQKNTIFEMDGIWLTPLISSASREELSSGLTGHVKADWQAVLVTDVKDRLLEEAVQAVKRHADKLLFYVADSKDLVQARIGDLQRDEPEAACGELEALFFDLKWTLYPSEWESLMRKIDELRPEPGLFSRLGGSLCRMWADFLLLREEAELLASAVGTNRIWPDWKVWLHRFADGVKGRMIDLGLSREVMYCLIRAMIYMKKHAGDKINQKDVAAHINMSRSYFSQCFAKFAGDTFGDILRNIRIEHAKSLLLESDYPVYEIASRAGFEDEKYFSRLFREIVGTSPSEYRLGR